MARNVEIKARTADLAALEARTAAIADAGPVPIAQDDTFFRCDAGRLKLRAFEDGRGELIFYRRPDRGGPKTSSYVIARTPEAAALREVLALAHGIAGRVVKQRTLYLVGRTRVHLDRVEGLGDFMELEVVLAEGEPEGAGEREALALMARLGIAREALVEGAYVDLLRAATG
jgi:predicted adenylyl cyclase CyaB